MASDLINRYLWLIEILISSGSHGLTLAEISRKCEQRYGEPYSRRTFLNHKNKVEEIFGIPVMCNPSTNRYSVEYGEDALDRDSTVDWLIDTFTAKNILSLSKERLSGRVSVEDIPSGHKWLTAILSHMQENKVLEVEYGKYQSTSSEIIHVLPYAVKEYAKRWYLVGFCRERNALRVYGLDRIKSIVDTEEIFKMPKKFDVDKLFEESFGIYLPEGKPAVLIELKTDAREARYLEDLPIHPSQRLKSRDADGHCIYVIRVVPNDNLIMEICKRGPRVEVLSPKSVRDEVADVLRRSYELYK